jgi:L-threonylcarbamoyladenylate synthase
MNEKVAPVISDTDPRVWDATGAVLEAGGLVVFCTESTYGIGARPDLHGEAMGRLAALKGRDSRKPFPLIAASLAAAEAYCDLSGPLGELGRALWPGPLTVAARPLGEVPAEVLSPTGTAGIRVSPHEVAQKVAALAGGVVTATSANFAGEDAARSVDDLGRLLQEVDLVIDSGPAPGAAPSTVVGWGEEGLIVYREGALPTSLLEQALKGRG